jgi:hypothetical protein
VGWSRIASRHRRASPQEAAPSHQQRTRCIERGDVKESNEIRQQLQYQIKRFPEMVHSLPPSPEMFLGRRNRHFEPPTIQRMGEEAMASSVRSAEQWLMEVDRVIRIFRAADLKESVQSVRQAAIKRLKDLGLTEGDALRYLKSKPDTPAGRVRG